MTAPAEPTSPPPRRGGSTALLLILLVAGVIGARYWIGAERSVTASAAPWRVSVGEPSGTLIHRPTAFDVTVVGPGDRPAEGLSVTLDLTMPDMEMPLNRFPAQPVPGEPGHYRGSGTYTMKGRWQIEAIVRKDGKVATGRRIVQVR